MISSERAIKNEPKEIYSIVRKGHKIKPKKSNGDYFMNWSMFVDHDLKEGRYFQYSGYGNHISWPEYSEDLKSGLVWILKGQKKVGLQMVPNLNRIWKPNYFKSGQMATILTKTIWNLDKMSGFSIQWGSE